MSTKAEDLSHVPPHLRAQIPFDGTGNGTHGMLLLADIVAAGIAPDPNPEATAAWNDTAASSD